MQQREFDAALQEVRAAIAGAKRALALKRLGNNTTNALRRLDRILPWLGHAVAALDQQSVNAVLQRNHSAKKLRQQHATVYAALHEARMLASLLKRKPAA